MKLLTAMVLMFLSQEIVAHDNFNGSDPIPIASNPTSPQGPRPQSLSPDYTSLQDVLIHQQTGRHSPDLNQPNEVFLKLQDQRRRELCNEKIVGVVCTAVAMGILIYAIIKGRKEDIPSFDLRSCLAGAGISGLIIPCLFLLAHMCACA